MGDFNFLHITSVADLPGYHAAAAFNTKRSEAFKETEEISPRMISDIYKTTDYANYTNLSAREPFV